MKTDKSKFVQGQFNLYTADHIPDTHREFYEKQQKNLPESTIKPTIPEHIRDEALVLYEMKKDTNYKDEVTYSIETHPIIALITENGTICRLRKDFGTKRYRFFTYNKQYSKAFTVDTRKRARAADHLDEPNNIGVWSDKKVNDWMDYCDKYLQVMLEVADDAEYTHEKHLQTVQDFIEALPVCNVTRSPNGNETWVDTDLFDVKFTHDKGVDYLRKDIKFKGDIADIVNIEKRYRNGTQHRRHHL